MLDGLRLMLEPECEIVAAVTDGLDLLEKAERLRPDLALVEVSLRPFGGIEVSRRLHQLLPGLKILLVATESTLESVLDGSQDGTSGYVLKQCGAEELRLGIRAALSGNAYVKPLAMHRDPASDLEAFARAVESAPLLTGRERDVLRLVAEGLSARDIATALKISVKTVAFHKANIKQKLEIHTTAELTKYALRHGVIS